MTKQAHRQIPQIVGANIRSARVRRGMSRRDLAQQLGTESQAIYRWENGRHRPSDASLHALGKALGIDYPDFFREPAEEAA